MKEKRGKNEYENSVWSKIDGKWESDGTKSIKNKIDGTKSIDTKSMKYSSKASTNNIHKIGNATMESILNSCIVSADLCSLITQTIDERKQ